MRAAYKLAAETFQEVALSAKRYYDQKVRPKLFQPGDRILLHNPHKKKQQNVKWQRTYSEEAEVVSRVNDVTYVVKCVKSGQRKVIHVDKMKLLCRPVSAADQAENKRGQ
jgi:hypothetical protein